jgi:hypothetical protein
VIKRTCPKCGGLSWVELCERRPVQKCLCGLFIWLDPETGRRPLPKVREVPLNIPRTDTKLACCLTAVRDIHPNTVNTEGVCRLTGLGSKETAAMLRGLLIRVIKRRGTLGGSEWTLSQGVVNRLQNQEDA